MCFEKGAVPGGVVREDMRPERQARKTIAFRRRERREDNEPGKRRSRAVRRQRITGAVHATTKSAVPG